MTFQKPDSMYEGTLTLPKKFTGTKALDSGRENNGDTKLQSFSPGSIGYNLNEREGMLYMSLSGDEQITYPHYTGFQFHIENITLNEKGSQAHISYSRENERISLGIIEFEVEHRLYGDREINFHTGKILLTEEQISLLKIAKNEVHCFDESISDEVIEILNSGDYAFVQKRFLHQITSLGISENEQINLIIYLNPGISVERMRAIKNIYDFFAQYNIFDGIIENLEGIDIDGKKLEYLKSQEFLPDENFFTAIILFLSNGDESFISAYVNNKTSTANIGTEKKKSANLKIISFQDFDRKMANIAKEKGLVLDKKETGRGGILYKIGMKTISIGASAKAKPKNQSIRFQQQNTAIEMLGCTKDKWSQA